MRRCVSHKKNAIRDIETYNVTGTFKIDKLNGEKIAGLPGAVYNPEVFSSVDVYVDRCLFRIFPTGTISCFGISRDQITRAELELFARLRSVDINIAQTPAVTFHSESSAIRLGKKLLLRKAYYLLKGSEFSEKGPRLLSIRLNKPEVTMQLFEDGTITCLGARNRRASKQAFSQILDIIEENCLTA